MRKNFHTIFFVAVKAGSLSRFSSISGFGIRFLSEIENTECSYGYRIQNRNLDPDWVGDPVPDQEFQILNSQSISGTGNPTRSESDPESGSWNRFNFVVLKNVKKYSTQGKYVLSSENSRKLTWKYFYEKMSTQF
jgi:hypothetical protein